MHDCNDRKYKRTLVKRSKATPKWIARNKYNKFITRIKDAIKVNTYNILYGNDTVDNDFGWKGMAETSLLSDLAKINTSDWSKINANTESE